LGDHTPPTQIVASFCAAPAQPSAPGTLHGSPSAPVVPVVDPALEPLVPFELEAVDAAPVDAFEPVLAVELVADVDPAVDDEPAFEPVLAVDPPDDGEPVELVEPALVDAVPLDVEPGDSFTGVLQPTPTSNPATHTQRQPDMGTLLMKGPNIGQMDEARDADRDGSRLRSASRWWPGSQHRS